MTHRFPWLRAAAAACVAGVALGAAPAHAGMFDDDEARRAVLDLRSRTDNLTSQLSAAQRTILDQSGRLDQLNQQVATLRGQNEDLTNRLTTLERQQRDGYTDLDTRLKKFEPQQTTVDGVEGTVQPGETDAFNAASQQFRAGDFKGAAASFRAFIAKYPQSPYQPVAQYWLGNAQYALRDYKGSTATWQALVKAFPQHPRAGDALVAIGTNQLEQGQKAAAKRTFEQVVSQFQGSSSAQAAQAKIDSIK
ncbi:tol-pal system protein YbgF [Burkholderia gladioli]|jgi:tol-pal system protein YbgF|uniref:Cell division coordinator CpoB n=1 Tax=Burkholderia gladioli TaxID=28095 RepID=A0AB38TTH6_BURGA|nr:tol-pal system protein YbgF [Burkholderia gladioli]ATF85367.1 tol-pal system protein YbgF [Burkholderia gladioli pv. gladioli]KAF1064289.1 Cell division coordinator CpoB [Burkholderia gladioli]KGE07368.1 Tol system periplasmic component YbgF [Burkholderia gladioli]KKJ07182.1 Tol system periplasmic component YbgF [Burkholderia gladioli]MBA1360589.1 tol-pal system protein YbgF [Burkholderia gladioli]